jgi:hypothetical protein
MKPVYLNKKEVPQEVRDKAIEIGGEKELWKLFAKEVLMEQELATSDEDVKVKNMLRAREGELGVELRIKDWACFTIG